MSDTDTLYLHYGNMILGNVKIYNFRYIPGFGCMCTSYSHG